MKTLDLPNGYYALPPGKLANVATFLELVARPGRPLKSLPPGTVLEHVAGGDLAAYRAAFRAIGQDWMWFSRILMPDAELQGILRDPLVSSCYLKQGQETIGLLELDFREEGQCELAFFGLARNAIGQGLGRALMDEAIRLAFEKPIRRLWVHTCTFDAPQALHFYMRSGFRAYARMVEIHDDPRLSGKLPPDASPQVPIIRGQGEMA
jgi:GNAT superfamily N-acetyltransferase